MKPVAAILAAAVLLPGNMTAVLASPPDNVWKLKDPTPTDQAATITVNGEITYADRLLIRLVKGHCEFANVVVFFSTTRREPPWQTIGGKPLKVTFAEKDMYIRLLYGFPFMKLIGMRRAVLDLGFDHIGALKKLLGGRKYVTLKLLDDERVQSSRYFDVMENKWPLTGLNEALALAQQECKDLSNRKRV